MKSYLEKLKTKTRLFEELPKVPKGFETGNKATPPTAKSAKKPFDSFGSTPRRRFLGNKEKNKNELWNESMTTCLHEKPCERVDTAAQELINAQFEAHNQRAAAMGLGEIWPTERREGS